MSALTSVIYVLSSNNQYFLITTSRGIFLGRFMEKCYKLKSNFCSSSPEVFSLILTLLKEKILPQVNES